MPTYQYSCTECGHFFEQFQSFSEESLTVCPQCEGRLRKVFNAVGVVFKGSGFYRTDSRSGSGEKGEGGSSTAGAGTETGSPATPATPDGGSGGGSGGSSGAGSGDAKTAGSTASTSGSSGSAPGSSTSAA